jgi:hypothetical protein
MKQKFFHGPRATEPKRSGGPGNERLQRGASSCVGQCGLYQITDHFIRRSYKLGVGQENAPRAERHTIGVPRFSPDIPSTSCGA